MQIELLELLTMDSGQLNYPINFSLHLLDTLEDIDSKLSEEQITWQNPVPLRLYLTAF